MINNVKGSGQVQESKKGNFVIIKAKKNCLMFCRHSSCEKGVKSHNVPYFLNNFLSFLLFHKAAVGAKS